MIEQIDRLDSHSRWLVPLASVLTIANVTLALNFFPLVPFLGWLNYGHGGTPWLPDFLLSGLLPAGYYLYWHFWYVVALPALACALPLRHRRAAQWLVMINLATIFLYGFVRLVLFLAAIRPDSI